MPPYIQVRPLLEKMAAEVRKGHAARADATDVRLAALAPSQPAPAAAAAVGASWWAVAPVEEEVARLHDVAEAALGLGRIDALHYCSPALYQIH